MLLGKQRTRLHVSPRESSTSEQFQNCRLFPHQISLKLINKPSLGTFDAREIFVEEIDFQLSSIMNELFEELHEEAEVRPIRTLPYFSAQRIACHVPPISKRVRSPCLFLVRPVYSILFFSASIDIGRSFIRCSISRIARVNERLISLLLFGLSHYSGHQLLSSGRPSLPNTATSSSLTNATHRFARIKSSKLSPLSLISTFLSWS